jgi:hypothetical protein
LTPEQTEGPFYLPLELSRQDITEGKAGVPLRLRIAVADINACTMLPDAAVDIWHCDDQGYYSGVDANPGGNVSQNAEAGAGTEAGTFLRGIQLTNADGIAEFQTIYPGWYAGRTVHIHMKVHVGGTPEVLELATPAGPDAGTYEGGHVSQSATSTSCSVTPMAAASCIRGSPCASRSSRIVFMAVLTIAPAQLNPQGVHALCGPWVRPVRAGTAGSPESSEAYAW